MTTGHAPLRATTRGAATRAAILDVAIQQFGQHGFRQTSVASIARGVGVTAPAVHAHFATKDELFDAALEQDASAFFEIIGHLAAQRPGPLGWVAAVPELLAEVQARPLIRRVMENQDPGMLGRLASLRPAIELRDQFAQAIETGQRIGVLRRDVPAASLASGIETLLFALMLAAVQTGLVGTDAERTEGIVAIITAGILGTPDQPR